MKLYYLQGACSLAVHIVLEWVGTPYTTQAVSREELKQPDYLAINPLGSVPALVNGDLTLTQNSAILQYIAEKFPEANLIGHSIDSRAEVLRWLGMINSDIHTQYALIFGVARYVQQETCQKELIASAQRRIKQIYTLIDQQLADKNYVATERSIADPYLFVTLRWAERLQIDLSEFTHLLRFYQRMQDDTSVQIAIAAENFK